MQLAEQAGCVRVKFRTTIPTLDFGWIKGELAIELVIEASL